MSHFAEVKGGTLGKPHRLGLAISWMGCMVDPNLLENCGIESKDYYGYAFGMGVERITNLKYQVKDLRMFSENDVRFLGQFEAAH
jgi:phenylalanyl-tRNA synthetase alpha chain